MGKFIQKVLRQNINVHFSDAIKNIYRDKFLDKSTFFTILSLLFLEKISGRPRKFFIFLPVFIIVKKMDKKYHYLVQILNTAMIYFHYPKMVTQKIKKK